MESKRTYTIDKTGLSLPIEEFQRFGLKEGDDVAIIETEQGLVVLPRVGAAMSVLGEIGAVLKAKGVTLEDLMERGRKIRGDILREKYGIEPGDDD